MCGITGVGEMGGRTLPVWIKTMTDTLRHRGPDDEGFLAIDNRRKRIVPLAGRDSRVHESSIDSHRQTADFFFGHRRLSILDPSPSGHQPMSSRNGKIWVVFNGEIYNYIELREELKKEGFVFDTGSDTEVLLAAYEKWGPNCIDRFDGMWAFALYDLRENILFGSRDRFGVKPFYYFKDSGRFAFASEIKALLTLPFVPNELNHGVLFDYLAFGGIDFVEESFFKHILELQPSHAFTYDLSNGDLRTWQYFTLDFHDNPERFDAAKSRQHIEKIRELINDAVRLRLRSDVPVGSSLSGGIDSSSVVCIISRLMAEGGSLNSVTGDRQKVFTVGFPGSDVDESDWARLAAAKANARSVVVNPTVTEFLEDIEDIAYYQDTPYGSPSVYAQYRVMKAAGENGVTVLLDGQGADELFTGYTHYYDVFFYRLLRNFDFSGFMNEWRHLDNAPVNKRYIVDALYKQVRRNILPHGLVKKYRLKPKPQHRYIGRDFWETHNGRSDLITARDFKSLNGMLYEYFTRQKLGRLLKYEDRNSMRFSIEARTPFADHLDLVKYAFQVPDVYKIHNGWSKYLLREAMDGVLPEKIRVRKDKKGFSIPDITWLKALKTHLKEYITPDLGEFLNIPAVMALLDNDDWTLDEPTVQAVWNLAGFAVWKKMYQPG